AINSCIRLAHSIAGQELTVVEDLSAGGDLHPAQEALVKCHGSQCGFCTPGFAMSMFALHENSMAAEQTVDRATAQEALSGNLCRCTGYRPILDAAMKMQSLSKSERSAQYSCRLEAKNALENKAVLATDRSYLLPRHLNDLLTLRCEYPKAQIVAGCTDVGLWINKGDQQFDQMLDVTQVQELRRIERYPHHIAIGAAVTLQEAYAALVQDRPQLNAFAKRFAGLTVRNSGTLGGNVANGSPIGDSMPLLIALGANVVLMSTHGHREMPLEKLYTGYRKNVIAADEVLAWIKVPLPTAQEFSRIYKVSKRFDDDISAVCLAISVQRDGETLKDWSIGVGGVAATPVRAIKTEALCADSMPASGSFDAIKRSLQDEFQPISDMRASSAYRRTLLGNLVERFSRELRGEAFTRLEDWADLEVLA
ncbi:MAG: xanthine dehydrogenase small subunit, partial [Brachymonas sp.]|nr:xanthine dehydrogenase small subunit [Brachymonas sp.]